MLKHNKGQCYFCGDTADSMDHLPPKNLFPKGMREKLIKVPACRNHNQGFSMIDDRSKIYIQGSSNSKTANEISNNVTIRGLKRDKAQKFLNSLLEKHTIVNEDNHEIIVDSKLLGLYFERIMKGLFYYHNKKICTGEVKNFLSCDLDNAMVYDEAVAFFTLLDTKELLLDGHAVNNQIFRYHYYISFPFFYVKMCFYEEVIVLSILKYVII